jgi:hypothetical protein
MNAWARRCAPLPTLCLLIIVYVGRPYFLEVKRLGAYQSSEQKEFQRRAETAGPLYAVVRPIEDVQRLGL